VEAPKVESRGPIFDRAKGLAAAERLKAKAKAQQAAVVVAQAQAQRNKELEARWEEQSRREAEAAPALRREREELAARERQMEREAAERRAVAEEPKRWSPPRAEPVEPVPLEEDPGAYRFRDALKDSGGLTGPDLDEALAAMRKGKRAGEVVAGFDRGGEHDALAGVLEEIAAVRDSGDMSAYHRLRKAYQRTFKAGEPTADRTLQGFEEQARQGAAPIGGVPRDTNELIAWAWDDAVRPPVKVDRDATAFAQEAADWEAFNKSLSLREGKVWSGEQPLGEVREGRGGRKMFVPTADAERLPADYQTALLQVAGIDVGHGMVELARGQVAFARGNLLEMEKQLANVEEQLRFFPDDPILLQRRQRLQITTDELRKQLSGEPQKEDIRGQQQRDNEARRQRAVDRGRRESTADLRKLATSEAVLGEETATAISEEQSGRIADAIADKVTELQRSLAPVLQRLQWDPHHPTLAARARYLQGQVDALTRVHRNFVRSAETERGEVFAMPQGELPGMAQRAAGELDPAVMREMTEAAGIVVEGGAADFPSYARGMEALTGGAYPEYRHAAYEQVRYFTEAWPLRDRLTPQEEAERYDPITGELADRTGAAGREPQLSGAVGGTGRPRRPGLRVVDFRDLPAPRALVRTGEYTGPGGHGIDEVQRFAVNAALTAFEDGKSAYLLGDGTGVGKTGTELAIAHQSNLRTKLPSLIVTQSQPIIENRFKADRVKFGIPSQGTEFITYNDLSAGKVPLKEYGVVIYDEAQNLKNAGSLRETFSKEVKARHTVYATATPMDSPAHASYFLSKLTGRTKQQVADALGFHYEERVVEGKRREYAVLNRGVSWAAVVDRVKRYRNEAVKNGQLIRREYPFFGEAALREAKPYDASAAREQAEMIEWWDARIAAARPGSNYRRNLSGQKTLELGRWAEAQKLPEVLEAVLEDYEAGKAVIVFGEGFNPTTMRSTGKVVPGILGELAKELEKRKIPFAKVFEDSPKEKALAASAFQKRGVRVLLATPRSGGAGLDMDDQVGNRPRSAHAATLNFSAEVLDQMFGRVSRRNTASPAEFHVWVNRRSFADGRRMEVADRKMKVLRNIQAGEDLDTSAFEREGGEHGMPVDMQGAFSFERPESSAEMAARLKQEESKATAAEQKRRMAERQAQRLTGTTGDLGQGDMFGEGDLWSPRETEAKETPKVQRPTSNVEGGEREHGMVTLPAGGTPGLPVSMDALVKERASVAEVNAALEAVSRAAGGRTPIRSGRIPPQSKVRGIYKERPEVVRLRSLDDIPAAAHEVAHDLGKQVFGSVRASGSAGGSPAALAEMEALGRALYGTTKPLGGYHAEGWAEFFRTWLTTDDAARVAPALTRWLEGTFMPAHPQVGAALQHAKSLITTHRLMGTVARAQMVREPGAFRRVAEALGKFVGYQGQVESFASIERLRDEANRLRAKRGLPELTPSEDPFQLASWKRGSAGALVNRMATRGMVGVWGNVTGPGLKEVLAPVQGKRPEFLLYLFGRRAVERWTRTRTVRDPKTGAKQTVPDPKHPGITLADARHLVQLYDSPEFRRAADGYYKWWDGVLDYVVQADPGMADVVKAIKQGSHDYAPLARMIDPAKAKQAAARAASNPMFRMRGSALPVKDIFDQTFINAARLVNRANRALVANAIVKVANIEGMGHLIENVPRANVRKVVNIEQVRAQLEDMGLDTTGIPEDRLLEYWTPADVPKGTAPIIAVGPRNARRWFQVEPELYHALDGLLTWSFKNAFPGVPAVGAVLDLTLGAHTRFWRLTTTGLRPGFSLITNPVRDLQTLLMQSGQNPAKALAAYPAALAGALRAGFGGKGNAYTEAFYNLGAHMGQPLGLDISHTKRVSNELFHGRLLCIVKNPVDHLRQVLGIPESVARVAELKAIADKVGWTPGTPMTPDQAVAMGLAAKRVTVDFSASGDVSRILNQAVPFYNPAVQGLRAFGRAFKEHPVRSLLLGSAVFLAPTLANWWRNKDEEWYRALPWRERYLYTWIDDGKNLWRLPRPFEWGHAFMSVPEALADAWYRRDPTSVNKALGVALDQVNPMDYPVLLKAMKEQWENRIAFWDRPIVPRSMEGLPPKQQVQPYTTMLARAVNKALPDVSPLRVDAFVRAVAGGAVMDALPLIGLGAPRSGREREPSDLPVAGTLFRRGGHFNAQNQHVADFYDRYGPARAAMQGWSAEVRRAQRQGDQPRWPAPDFKTQLTAQIGNDTAEVVRVLTTVAGATKDNAARERLYREAGEVARKAVEQMRMVEGHRNGER
jgi:hypothetical protein